MQMKGENYYFIIPKVKKNVTVHRKKVIFEDVDVKFQAHLCLKFDVDAYENAFFLWTVTEI